MGALRDFAMVMQLFLFHLDSKLIQKRALGLFCGGKMLLHTKDV